MDFSKLAQIQLSSETTIKPFKCAEDDLNGFLFDDAKHFQNELMAVTYLLEDHETNVTVAYFSLLADKITFNPDEKTFGIVLIEISPTLNVAVTIRP